LGETYAVPEPVGGGRDTNTSRTDGKGENFADNDPSSRAPGHGEDGDVEADEGNHGADSGVVVAIRLTGSGANNADNELHGDHTNRAVEQDSTTSKFLNNVE
jgi:hypothetical protein